ncbi:MAG: hypothetical protein DMG94_06200, partial [Acidobacteria bacterium]
MLFLRRIVTRIALGRTRPAVKPVQKFAGKYAMIAASHINQLWMRKPQLIVIVFLLVAFCSAQQPAWQPAPGHLTLLLWPHGAPGAQPNLPAEVNQSTSKND